MKKKNCLNYHSNGTGKGYSLISHKSKPLTLLFFLIYHHSLDNIQKGSAEQAKKKIIFKLANTGGMSNKQ